MNNSTEEKFSLKFTPLGGLGQIGANMSLIEGTDEGIIVDTGILFPRERNFGISYLISDFYTVDKKKFKALIITHAHEDHLGAIHKLLEYHPSIEIWAPKFAAFVLKEKLQETGQHHNINIYDHGHDFEFKNFTIKTFQVNHSTPHSFGLYIKTQEDWGVLYCTDFKINHDDSYEPHFNLEELAEIMKAKPKNLSLVDSTNILHKEKTPSEIELLHDIEKILNHKGRIFVTLFPSNIYRLTSFLQVAQKLGKECFFYGRSMHFYIRCALETEIFPFSPEIIKDVSDGNIETPNTVIFVSGCQCDFRSSLHTIARGHSAYTQIKGGDRVIFSSIRIPGNEQQIQQVQNMMTESGAEIITEKDFKIHCSGHPGQEDLKLLYKSLPITHAIPIHGESHFLKRHEDFIHENFPNIKTKLAYNNYELILNNKIHVIKKEAKDLILCQRNHNIIDRTVISERRKIAENGVVFVSIHKKQKNVQIYSLGVQMSEDTHDALRDEISHKAFKQHKDDETIRVFVRKYLEEYLDYRPVAVIATDR
ncbi:MAG: ribonuclease J [Halobacteriovoraceae bacterium]|nr:ribonuclease J [Halobacteriovoraceae bacterium]